MSSDQARGWRSPPVYKSVVVQYLKDGRSSSFRHPLYSPYPPTGHSSVGRVVRPYEPPPLLTCLRRVRTFTLSTSRACNEVNVENGSHRTDIRPTSRGLTLHVVCVWCACVWCVCVVCVRCLCGVCVCGVSKHCLQGPVSVRRSAVPSAGICVGPAVCMHWVEWDGSGRDGVE